MTISELTLKSRDEEPVRRLEIFTGSERRREWLPEEKARIVAESYDAGETVSAVAPAICIVPAAAVRLATVRAGAIGECTVTGAIVCSSSGRGIGAQTGGEAREIDTQAEGCARSRRD
jgi:transposase-like protein